MANDRGSAPTSAREPDRINLAIGFIVLAMFCISLNDMLIKQLSDSYPLHQMVLVRSLIGIAFTFCILQFEGGIGILRTRQPGLHLVRGLLLVTANMSFFAGLAVIPLADATALFFVAPLFITVLSVPLLGETVGWRRFAAVIVGFVGVLVMLRPGGDAADGAGDRIALMLPIVGAFAYSCSQILTRRLGAASKASAMAIYIQATLIVVCSGFWLVAGDGRYAEGLESKSAIFLLRAWVWPSEEDWSLLIILGMTSGVIGYSLSQAYRSASAATVAPFEYIAMPMAIAWGWVVFGELPDMSGGIGIALIVGAGLYVFMRETHRARPIASGRRLRRF